jgi:CBS domain-containing protein
MNRKNATTTRRAPSSRASRDARERAAELMTEDVATVTPADSVSEAAVLMQECDCGSLPVVGRGGRPIGVITDRDIALFIAPRSLNASRVAVRECMTDEVVTAHVEDPIDECLQTMARHQVRRLPVVDDDGTLVGIISQADLARHADSHPGDGERRSVAKMVSKVSRPG